MLYNNSRRPTLQKEYPDTYLTDISKIIAGEWRLFSDDEKTYWQTKTNNLKFEYDMTLTENSPHDKDHFMKEADSVVDELISH